MNKTPDLSASSRSGRNALAACFVGIALLSAVSAAETRPPVTPVPSLDLYVVTAGDYLNVRKEPSREAEIIDKVLEGSIVLVLGTPETANDWRKIRIGRDEEGYVFALYLRRLNEFPFPKDRSPAAQARDARAKELLEKFPETQAYRMVSLEDFRVCETYWYEDVAFHLWHAPGAPFWIEGDFNGDQKRGDVAILTIRKDATPHWIPGGVDAYPPHLRLFVFHEGADTVHDLPEAGLGILRAPKGQVQSPVVPEPLDLKNDGIGAYHFGKGGSIYYWNGETYVPYQVSD